MRCVRSPLVLLVLVVAAIHVAADPVFLVPPRLKTGADAIVVVDPTVTSATACLRSKASESCDALSATDIMSGSLAVPQGTPVAEYTLQIDWVDSSSTPGSTAADVAVIADPVFLLADLDKPKYKPSETVQLRLLALKSDFSPAPGGSIEVTVTSPPPSKFKILRETLDISDFGDANLTLPIADEALLGMYEINAVHTTLGATATVSVEVDEFVLPKFEVSLEINEESVNAQSPGKLTGKVTAMYTFGEWVPGELSLTIRQDGNSWNPWIGFGGRFAPDSIPVPTYNDLLQLEVSLVDGTYDFGGGIPASGALSVNEWGGDLMVEAKVTDPATGTSEVAQATVKVSRNRESVKVAASKDYFKPGLPITVVVNALDGAGGPVAAGTSYVLEVAAFQQMFGHATGEKNAAKKVLISDRASSPITVTTDAEGRAWAAVDIPQDDPTCCDPSKYLAADISEDSCCFTNVQVAVFPAADASPSSTRAAEACISRASSRASKYLMVDRRDGSEAPAAVGTDVTLDLAATADWAAAATGNLRYTVVSRGVIVAGGSVDSAALPGYTPTQSGHQTVASATITVTEAMAPLAKVLFLFGDGAEVVADAIEIPVAIAPSNQVTAAFSADTTAPPTSPAAGTPSVSPGGAAQISLGASPGSRIFYTAVDRAVSLLGPRAEVTAAGAVGMLGGLSVEVAAKIPQAPADAVDHKFFDPSLYRCCRHVGSVIADAGLISAVESVGMEDLFYPCVPTGPYGNCNVGCYPIYSGDDDMVMEDEAEMAAGDPQQNPAAGGRSDAGQAADTPRRFFPETWLWSWLDLEGAETSASFDVSAPDTITTWELSAFAASPTDGLGVVADKSSGNLRVFKPFFVDVRLPFHATRGEGLEVLVTLFNYDEDATRAELEAEVTLAAATGSEGKLEVTTDETGPLTVPRGGFATRTFTVRAAGLGSLKLAAGATVTAPEGTGYADFLEKPLLVRPEGVPVEQTINKVIQLSSDGATESHSISLALPDGVVDGSASAQMTVVGDIMGPTLTGLESLLQVPTGCGEQNMITLAPNVYVASYLAEVNGLTEAVRKRALSNMVRGYQRELTYRHGTGSNAGGFSAFGESDASASMWLTAFVVKVFGQSSAFITVDDDVMRSAGAWMTSQQAEDGSFPAVGQVIHTEMVGGVAGPMTMTAYVLGALADAPAAVGSPEALVRAAGYLDANLDASPKAEPTPQDVYIAALAASGLARVAANAAALGVTDTAAVSSAAAKARSLLDGYKQSGEGNIEWWGHEGAAVAATRALRRRALLDIWWEEPKPQPTTIESTAYGLLSALASGPGGAGAAYPVAKWLLAQRTASGGFLSTQDTVVGLQALAEYSAAAYDSAGGVDVAFTNGDSSGSLSVTSSNFDVLQVRELSLEAGSVDVTATAAGATGGSALVSATVRFYRIAPEAQSMYDLTVEWAAVVGGDAGRKKVTACAKQGAALATLADSGGPGCPEAAASGKCGYEVEMAVMTLAMFTGFEPDTATLDRARDGAALVQRWDYDGDKVSLYLLGVPAAEPVCVEFEAVRSHRVEDYQPIYSEVFAYYEPEVRGPAVLSAADAGLERDDGGSAVTEPPVASPVAAPVAAPSPPPPPVTTGETSGAPSPLRHGAAALAAAVLAAWALVL